MEPGNNQAIFINLIHFPVFTLGIGKRVGIWVQGCTIGCRGCISEHTWQRQDNHKQSVAKVLQEVNKFKEQKPDGITISGGEPFEQPEALYYLLSGLRRSGYDDIMVYTGYPYPYLATKYSQLLQLIDILVDGPFKEGLETGYIWKGSENQGMIFLTENSDLKEKYLAYGNRAGEKRNLQVVTDYDDFVHIIGIPEQKDGKVIKDGFV
jgi:anaerobic ribonucleoside-triphosphate reductase activating protein